MDEPQKYYDWWKNSCREPHIVWFHPYKTSQIGKFKFRQTEVVHDFQGLGRNRRWFLMGIGFLLGWWKCSKIDCSGNCITVNIPNKKTNKKLNLHFKWVNFMVCELNLNRTVSKKNANRQINKRLNKIRSLEMPSFVLIIHTT